MKKRGTKIPALLARVKRAIAAGDFLDTTHAVARRSERFISRPEILQVLRNGWHEKNKDQYREEYHSWNYAIRGVTVDGRELRIVVSFEEGRLLIVTAIDLEKSNEEKES